MGLVDRKYQLDVQAQEDSKGYHVLEVSQCNCPNILRLRSCTVHYCLRIFRPNLLTEPGTLAKCPPMQVDEASTSSLGSPVGLNQIPEFERRAVLQGEALQKVFF